MANVNKVMLSDESIASYINGKTITDVARSVGLSISTTRLRLRDAGVVRSMSQAQKASRFDRVIQGRKLGRSPCGKATREKLRVKARHNGQRNAKAWRINSNGYSEFTRGPHKWRMLHDVKMEKTIRRRLKPNEVVHHIDQDKQNNKMSNLQLMTRSAHTKLHREMQTKSKES